MRTGTTVLGRVWWRLFVNTAVWDQFSSHRTYLGRLNNRRFIEMDPMPRYLSYITYNEQAGDYRDSSKYTGCNTEIS